MRRKESDERMETKKLMATFAILIIALGIAGFAYAHWEKIVTIDGTVTTGTLHVKPSFSAELVQDKDVAQIIYEWNGETNTLTVKLSNVFPCLTVKGWFDFENDGTIPVKLKEVKITMPSGLSYDYNPKTGEFTIVESTPIAENVIAIGKLDLSRWSGFPQIDPQQTVYVDFKLHFEEALRQTQEYTFKIQLIFWNWNEVK